MALPTLKTDRLVLRAFSMADCDAVVKLAGERDVAATTLLIPHPYSRADAEGWIAGHSRDFESGMGADWAITLADGTLVGAIGVRFSKDHYRADFGYWIGVPYWGRGYATEAAREIVRHAFEDRGMERVTAHHFANNPASGRVIEKAGLEREGVFPRHVQKWGEFVDCIMYGLVRSRWEAKRVG